MVDYCDCCKSPSVDMSHVGAESLEYPGTQTLVLIHRSLVSNIFGRTLHTTVISFTRPHQYRISNINGPKAEFCNAIEYRENQELNVP